MASVGVRDVKKSFGPVEVLSSIDLEVADGEFLALLGPSGCGKSTLIRILAGLERPDAGTVRLGERVVDAERIHVPPEERGLGMVFQSYAVWPHKRVRENVAYPLRRQKKSPDEVKKSVERALALVQLTGLSERYPHELSGGQQQRVALARALVGEPTVLLLDEPLSNLDARLREEMRGEIAALRRRLGVTVVLVTHDQAEALSTADRVAVLRQGRIVQVGSPQELYRNPSDLYVAETVGALNAIPVTGVSESGSEISVDIGVASVVIPRGPIPSGPLVLGVRPEHVIPDPDGPLEAEVEASAFLGDRVELRFRIGTVTVRALLPTSTVEVGAKVRLRLEPALLLRRLP